MGGEKRHGKALSRWLELNERQRVYLAAVYRVDQEEEEWQRSAWSRGWERRPADEWRWILYGSPLIETSSQTPRPMAGLAPAGFRS